MIDKTALSNFDKNYKAVRGVLAKDALTQPLVAVLPGKVELRKCITNPDYAKREHAELSAMGAFDFFVSLCNVHAFLLSLSDKA